MSGRTRRFVRADRAVVRRAGWHMRMLGTRMLFVGFVVFLVIAHLRSPVGGWVGKKWSALKSDAPHQGQALGCESIHGQMREESPAGGE
jgi:hypothetical protein